MLGPGPDPAARRASVRVCCHRVEAQPGRPRSCGTPLAPAGTLSWPGCSCPPPGCRSNWTQMALAEGLLGLSAWSWGPRVRAGVRWVAGLRGQS